MTRLGSIVALALALALAGCGGSSGPGSGGGSAEGADLGATITEEDAPGLSNDPTYIEGGNICVNLPIEQLAAQYGVAAEADAVAKAVAADYPAGERDKAYQGCLDVLEKGGRGGAG